MATVQFIDGRIVSGVRLTDVQSVGDEGSRRATAHLYGKTYPVYNSIVDGPNNIWFEQMPKREVAGEQELSPEAIEAGRRFLENMAGGFKFCPICGVRVERKEQLSCCVYARPCGHRLYHGTLPEEEKQG